jgi:hypothetical protein
VTDLRLRPGTPSVTVTLNWPSCIEFQLDATDVSESRFKLTQFRRLSDSPDSRSSLSCQSRQRPPTVALPVAAPGRPGAAAAADFSAAALESTGPGFKFHAGRKPAFESSS